LHRTVPSVPLLDEQVFRYNNRKKPMNDGARFEKVMSHVFGKRVTYAELTGKNSNVQAPSGSGVDGANTSPFAPF
jgi:hypothetical protein